MPRETSKTCFRTWRRRRHSFSHMFGEAPQENFVMLLMEDGSKVIARLPARNQDQALHPGARKIRRPRPGRSVGERDQRLDEPLCGPYCSHALPGPVDDRARSARPAAPGVNPSWPRLSMTTHRHRRKEANRVRVDFMERESHWGRHGAGHNFRD